MPSTLSIIEGLTPRKDAVEPAQECSLWKAFDEMQLCYTVAPQMRHYYRYGTMQDCGPFKTRFFACLRSKRLPAAEAHALLSATGVSPAEPLERPSASIWEIRKEPPENYPPPDPTAGLDELRAAL